MNRVRPQTVYIYAVLIIILARLDLSPLQNYNLLFKLSLDLTAHKTLIVGSASFQGQ